MELTIQAHAFEAPTASIAEQATAILRPWGLLVCGMLAYAAYTALDERVPLREQPVAPIVFTPIEQAFEVPEAPAEIRKCIKEGAVTYSDSHCDAGAFEELLPVAPAS